MYCILNSKQQELQSYSSCLSVKFISALVREMMTWEEKNSHRPKAFLLQNRLVGDQKIYWKGLAAVKCCHHNSENCSMRLRAHKRTSQRQMTLAQLSPSRETADIIFQPLRWPPIPPWPSRLEVWIGQPGPLRLRRGGNV